MKKISFLAIMFLAFAPLIVFAQASPSITSISPSSITVGSSATAVTVNGINFVSGAIVNLNNTELVTSFVSSTQLIATVPTSNLTTTGSRSVTVENPNGATSNALTLTVVALPDTGFAPGNENDLFGIIILTGSALLVSILLFSATRLKWAR